jgi:hypothetical protein
VHEGASGTFCLPVSVSVSAQEERRSKRTCNYCWPHPFLSMHERKNGAHPRRNDEWSFSLVMATRWWSDEACPAARGWLPTQQPTQSWQKNRTGKVLGATFVLVRERARFRALADKLMSSAPSCKRIDVVLDPRYSSSGTKKSQRVVSCRVVVGLAFAGLFPRSTNGSAFPLARRKFLRPRFFPG